MKAVKQKCLCGHEEESHVSLRGGRAGCLAADNNDRLRHASVRERREAQSEGLRARPELATQVPQPVVNSRAMTCIQTNQHHHNPPINNDNNDDNNNDDDHGDNNNNNTRTTTTTTKTTTTKASPRAHRKFGRRPSCTCSNSIRC